MVSEGVMWCYTYGGYNVVSGKGLHSSKLLLLLRVSYFHGEGVRVGLPHRSVLW